METEEQKTEITEDKKTKKSAKKAFKAMSKAGRGFGADFKAFISKGNIIQLAVAFIMGAAFTAIVNSLVGDIFMPFFSLIFGKTDFGGLKWVISNDLTIYYGRFILAVINFVLISFVLFIIIKIMSSAGKGVVKIKTKNKKGEDVVVEVPVTPELTTTEQLLTDIKGLLLKEEDKPKKN